MIDAPNLSALGGIRHGFLTRAGGVSEGAYASLNCGFASGDDPARVARNRAIAMERVGMPPASLCTARLAQLRSAPGCAPKRGGGR